MIEKEKVKQLASEVKEYEDKDIVIVPGYSFNQKETIDDIYLRYNSKFKDGDSDIEGDKKYFFNICRNPCKVTTKAIDFDTKHINISTAAPGDPLRTWYFERDLKYWMKEQSFGAVLNRIFEELPIFGSVVIKVINGKPYFVDLRNFALEKSADTLDQSNYLIETHYYTPNEYKRIANEMGWENTDEVLEEHRNSKLPHIVVRERYGELEDEDGTYNYKRIFVADTGKDSGYVQFSNEKPKGIIIKEDIIEKHPYYEFHLEKIAGRWLGVGVVEWLFDAQVRENELANQLAKATYFASLHLWQTQDEGINVNLARDAENGQVLTSDSPINPIDMAERNLAYFLNETEKWMKNREEMTFSYDVVQGQRLPAGTPLGSAQLAAVMAGSHFDQIRENIALAVKQFLKNAIIPQFKKENKESHILNLIGEDFEVEKSRRISLELERERFRFIMDNKRFPTPEQNELMKSLIAQKYDKGEVSAKIPKDYYENFDYKIDIVITGESKDPSAMGQTAIFLLQAVTADPTMISDPLKRKLFFRLAEAGGINPNDLIPQEKPSLSETISPQLATKGAGGGVSAPVSLGQMTPSPIEKKI